MGHLVVISARFLACLAASAFFFLVVCAVLMRYRKWAWGVLAGVLTFVLTLATAADAVNAHYSFLPRLDDVVGTRTWPQATLAEATHAAPATASKHPQGAVVEVSLPGNVSGFGAHNAFVYLPPQYFTEPTARFPAIYLLHGSPGAPIDWFRANEAQRAGFDAARSGHPVLLVAPRVSRRWLDDSECVNRPRERIETYLVADVVPEVDGRFRTLADRTDRGIAGMSAGGFCALNLGLRHRNLFSAIIDMSGFDRPTHSGGALGLFGHTPDATRLADQNTPRLYAKTLPATPLMRIWLDSGRSDREAEHDIHEMSQLLTQPGWDVHVQLRSGGHTYAVWRPALFSAVPWVAAGMSDEPPH